MGKDIILGTDPTKNYDQLVTYLTNLDSLKEKIIQFHDRLVQKNIEQPCSLPHWLQREKSISLTTSNPSCDEIRQLLLELLENITENISFSRKAFQDLVTKKESHNHTQLYKKFEEQCDLLYEDIAKTFEKIEGDLKPAFTSPQIKQQEKMLSLENVDDIASSTQDVSPRNSISSPTQ